VSSFKLLQIKMLVSFFDNFNCKICNSNCKSI